MINIEKHLLNKRTPSFTDYYRGKIKFKVHGQEWGKFIAKNFPNIENTITSENVFKDSIDAYRDTLIPIPKALSGFKDSLVSLLTKSQAIAVVTRDGQVYFPENFEILDDGTDQIACIFSRSILDQMHYITIIDSRGFMKVWSKAMTEDSIDSGRDTSLSGYTLQEETTGNHLFTFSLDDSGMGGHLASLQDRINHSILNQTVVSEMYARPFWYLLNYEAPLRNPYMDSGRSAVEEISGTQSTGRIMATTSPGPFGQLEPPTIGDMIEYHNSLIQKVSRTTGIPEIYFQPQVGSQVSGRALLVLSKRFNTKVQRIRDQIEPILYDILELLGEDIEQAMWPSNDDVGQEVIDEHGLMLIQMGYPLEYVSSIVTPGIDLSRYSGDW